MSLLERIGRVRFKAGENSTVNHTLVRAPRIKKSNFFMALSSEASVMKIVIQLKNGEERTYGNADRVTEKEKYSIYVYDEDTHVLAILSKGDVKYLLTESSTE